MFPYIMSPHDWTRGAVFITAGVRAHARGEVGAIARGNVELLEMSDCVEHVCAFPTEVATVSLVWRAEYGWGHSAR
jgi:hypothetical protein